MSHPVTSILTTGEAVANDVSRLSICLRADGFSFSVATLDGVLLTLGDVKSDDVNASLVAETVAASGAGTSVRCRSCTPVS